MPDPSVLRRMLHVSDFVAEIMASYEAKSRTLKVSQRHLVVQAIATQFLLLLVNLRSAFMGATGKRD